MDQKNERLAGAQQRESVGAMEAPFTLALVVVSGENEVEIEREGAAEVGFLSADEMLGIIATVGNARAKATALITTTATASPMMVKRAAAAEDYPLEASESDPADTHWVWVRVRAGRSASDGVWVRYAVDEAPEGLDARPAQRPQPGSLGVVVVNVPDAGAASAEEFRPIDSGPKRARKRRSPVSHDRNLVTVAEFAAALDVAESTVFDWLTRGLPSVKTKGLGRRVLRQQAEAWLMNGGPERSRIAKRLAKGTLTSNGARAMGGRGGRP